MPVNMMSMAVCAVRVNVFWAIVLIAGLAIGQRIDGASAQDLLKGLDLDSPAMTEADMTREELGAALDEADQPLDLTGRRLNGLDLSELDLSGVILRSARLNGANLAGADLSGAVLDQAWMLNADLTDADLSGAICFRHS